MNKSENQISQQIAQAIILRDLLDYRASDYRIGPIGSTIQPNGEVAPIIVLQYKNHPKGVFADIDALINAVADPALQAQMLGELKYSQKKL